MKNKTLDVRAVILLVAVNSIIAVIVSDVAAAALSAGLILFFDMAIKADVKGVLKKCKRMWQVVIFAVIMQSIFITQGDPLVTIFGFSFLTTHGISMGVIIILRLFAIMCGAAALAEYSQGEIIEALTRFKLPYEFAYMIIIGIKFLPALKEEMQDCLTAIQLRGIELEKLKLGQKIKVYSYLLFPVISGTILKAKDLSASMETRGFRAYRDRTSMIVFKFDKKDVTVMVCFCIAELFIVIGGIIF